jgi:cell wall-associated NlpC family hydrolase
MPTAARLTSLVLVLVGTLVLAATVGADPDTIEKKRAEAESVLAQIRELDSELEVAVERWNNANVRLRQLETELAASRQRLVVTQGTLRRAQTAVAERLVSLYQGAEIDVVEVLLGARSFDDLLDGLDTAGRVAAGDVRIVEDARRARIEVERQQQALASALARQRAIVAERTARRTEIERGLAERRALYDSVREEIAVLEEAERRRQARLAAEARREAAASRHAASGTQGGPPRRHRKQEEPPALPAPAPSPPPSSGGAGHPEVVPVALRYLGVPYRWGGASPSGFDCSGFTMYVYGRIGISLPHSVSMQYGYGRSVARSQLQAGDLVFFNGLGHVGISLGGDRFVHAPHTGDVVKISSISEPWYAARWVGARRL